MAATADRRVLRRDRVVLWHHLDVSLVALVGLVTMIGLVSVYSATRGPATVDDPASLYYAQRQVMFIIAGVGLGAVATLVDYRQLRALVPIAYVGLIGLLMGVLVLGKEIKGARAWFDLGPIQLQPGEVGKVVVIATLAAFFANEETMTTSRLIRGLALVALPVALIYQQPDLGTAMVYGAMTMGIVVVAGATARQLAGLVLVVLIALAGGWSAGLVEQYQLARITSFLDEDAAEKEETKELAFNREQAEIAVGNGGLTGQGLFNGTQTRSELVPEQHADFIFTVVAEEFGFVGGVVLLVLLLMIILRIWRIAHLASDRFGMLLCVGVMSMLLFQVFQSVGMTLGIMPITGIPLPFVSYGGSAMLNNFVAIGLVLNVHMRRFA